MKNIIFTVLVGLTAVACSSVKLNPFDSSSDAEASGYQQFMCADKKHFEIKMVNQQENVWVKLQDSEVYLSALDEAHSAYGNSEYQLTLSAESASLTKAGSQLFSDCLTQS